MTNLKTTDEAYILWLDAGMPGAKRKLPKHLLDFGLVEVEDDEPHLTWRGCELAREIRSDDSHGGMAA